MNKLEKKQLRRKLEEKNDIKSALRRTRSLNEDISIRGIGLLKIQLTILPSFNDGESWDFREINGLINVYKARINTEHQQYLEGYQVVKNASSIGEEFIEYVKSISLPISCSTKAAAICDGTSYKVRIENGLGNKVILSWSEDPPEEWANITTKVTYFLEQLRQCEVTDFEV